MGALTPMQAVFPLTLTLLLTGLAFSIERGSWCGLSGKSLFRPESEFIWKALHL